MHYADAQSARLTFLKDAAMSKDLISAVLRESCHVSWPTAHKATNQVIDLMVGCILNEGEFKVPGLGTIYVVPIPAQIRANPRTQEKFMAPLKSAVRLKVSTRLKAAVIASQAKRGRIKIPNRETD